MKEAHGKTTYYSNVCRGVFKVINMNYFSVMFTIRKVNNNIRESNKL